MYDDCALISFFSFSLGLEFVLGVPNIRCHECDPEITRLLEYLKQMNCRKSYDVKYSKLLSGVIYKETTLKNKEISKTFFINMEILRKRNHKYPKLSEKNWNPCMSLFELLQSFSSSNQTK